MGTIGTFDSFTTARLGIYAAQQGLSLTGNNIANINTTGYTRQRLDQVSLKSGAHDMYRSKLDNHIGNGVLVTNLSQVRDVYLDIRYRNTSADVGYTEAMVTGLKDIGAILDEVGKGNNKGDGLLFAQLQNFAESLRTLEDDPVNGNDTLARTSAEALAALFNTYAGKLETLRQNTDKALRNEITSINDILNNIRELNTSIRKCDVQGDPALELRDERNRQIDALSKKLQINVTYSTERIAPGLEVEKLNIALATDNPDSTTAKSVLVDGIYATQIDIPATLPQLNPNYGKAGKTDCEFLYLKPDGKGTHDATEAKQSDGNPNYIVTMGKLLSNAGKEWEDSTTTWTPCPLPGTPGTTVDQTGTIGEKAVFTYKVTSSGWKAGDTFQIGKNSFLVGPAPNGHITETAMNDPETLAQFIVSKMGSDDYIITAEGDNIIFTARKNGEVDAANRPTLNFIPGTGNGNVDFALDTANAKYGVNSVAPTDPAPGTVTVGNVKTVLSYAEEGGKWYQVETVIEMTHEITLHDNDLYGSFQATRELLTENGEFATQDTVDKVDPNATIKRGIPYYQKSLDLLAAQFAQSYNDLNRGYAVDKDGNFLVSDSNGNIWGTIAGALPTVTYYTDAKGNYVGLASDFTGPGTPSDPVTGDPYEYHHEELSSKMNDVTKQAFQKSFANGEITDNDPKNPYAYTSIDDYLTKQNCIPMGGLLFSSEGNADNPDGINASNITVAKGWSTRETKVIPTFTVLFEGDVTHSTQSDNIGHMLSMMDKALTYDPKNLVKDAAGETLFIGSFNDMMNNMCTVLGGDRNTTTIQLNTHDTLLVDIDYSREGVSGVDLNDEAMNMMTYQKAYSAACRLMNTIDEAIERLINNTGLVGR